MKNKKFQINKKDMFNLFSEKIITTIITTNNNNTNNIYNFMIRNKCKKNS